MSSTDPKSDNDDSGADNSRERTRRRMAELGVPKGTDNPTLLALGATPLECGWRTPKGASCCRRERGHKGEHDTDPTDPNGGVRWTA